MKSEYKPFVEELIELCIKEDIGDGDLCCIPADEQGRMRLLCKQQGTIAGIEIAELVLRRLDPAVKFEQLLRDGDRVKPGDVAFYVSGRLRSLLQAERILLNIMQRMSGVATQTAVYVARLEGLHTRVLDTRKTTPGMRVLDKMAVKIGGGENHRMGLFDMVLLKDNHIDFAGGIGKAFGRIPGGQGQNDPHRMRCTHAGGYRRGFRGGRRRPHHVRQLYPGDDARSGAQGRRTLRNRIERRHHARQPARLRRMRRGLHLRRGVDPSDQVARHVAQGLRINRPSCEECSIPRRCCCCAA